MVTDCTCGVCSITDRDVAEVSGLGLAGVASTTNAGRSGHCSSTTTAAESSPERFRNQAMFRDVCDRRRDHQRSAVNVSKAELEGCVAEELALQQPTAGHSRLVEGPDSSTCGNSGGRKRTRGRPNRIAGSGRFSCDGSRLRDAPSSSNALPEVTPRELPAGASLQIPLERECWLFLVEFDDHERAPRTVPRRVR
jgi:hypothetical protein